MTPNYECFERIYATDLVYRADCWQLCGDAHCCNFGRYKTQFKLIARTPFQELPLLPGEYAYLQSKGWLNQFGDHDYRVTEFPIEGHVLKAEAIISRKPNCACDHDQRPTVCRLYPRLPVFNLSGQLITTEPLGIYEEIEQLANLPSACELTSIPFTELNKLLAIAEALSSSPSILFYLEAYRITKRYAAEALRQRQAATGNDNVLALFESGVIRQNLLPSDDIRTELSQLAQNFTAHYGALSL